MSEIECVEVKEREIESRGKGILELEVRNKIIWNVLEKISPSNFAIL